MIFHLLLMKIHFTKQCVYLRYTVLFQGTDTSFLKTLEKNHSSLMTNKSQKLDIRLKRLFFQCCVAWFVSPWLFFVGFFFCFSKGCTAPSEWKFCCWSAWILQTYKSTKNSLSSFACCLLLQGVMSTAPTESTGGNPSPPLCTEEKRFFGANCSPFVYSPIRTLVLTVFLFTAVAQLCRGLER